MKFLVVKKSYILLCIVLALLFVFCGVIEIRSTSSTNTPIIYDYTIVIDAGHGGIDPGGIGIKTKVKESDLNLAISKKLEKYLLSFGVRVIMTRNDLNGLYGTSTTGYKKRDMQERKNIILTNHANMVVSIHMNRYVRQTLRGAQVFYDPSSTTGKALALCIQNNFAKNLSNSDKGISIGDYYMLKCTTAPSVICECGYLSNPEDESLLIDTEYQDKVAYSIFGGIVEYLNMSGDIHMIENVKF